MCSRWSQRKLNRQDQLQVVIFIQLVHSIPTQEITTVSHGEINIQLHLVLTRLLLNLLDKLSPLDILFYQLFIL